MVYVSHACNDLLFAKMGILKATNSNKRHFPILSIVVICLLQ